MKSSVLKFLVVLFTVLLCSCSKDPSPMRFALITDTHLSRSNPRPLEDLKRSVDDINQNDSIDFVLLTGDITEAGDREMLEAAKETLDMLNKPYYITSGNHETTWSESGVMDFSRVFGDNRFTFEYNGVHFVGFNSGPVIRMADGHVAPQDITWVKHVLDSVYAKHDGKPVVVALHYPLRNGDVDNWFDVTDVLREYNVQFIVGGHYHRNMLCDADGIANVLGRSNLRDKDGVNGYTIVSIGMDSVRFAEKRVGEAMKPWLSLPFETKQYGAPDQSLRPSYAVNEEYANVHEVWQRQLAGGVYSTPAMLGDKLFVGDDVGTFYALDATSGAILWQYATGMRILSTPAIADGKVVFGSTNCNVYCLDVETGRVHWCFETSKAVMGCPVIHEGLVYISGSDNCMRALSLSDGKEVWCFDGLKGYSTSKPLVYGDNLYFGVWDCNMYALNLKTGKPAWIWNNGTSNDKYSPAAVWPVATDGRIYFSAPDRYFTCLDAATGEVVWRTNRYKVRETVGLSVDESMVFSKCMWDTVIAVDAKSKKFEPIWASHVGFGYEHNPCMLVERDGVVMVGTRNGLLYGLNKQDGSVLWCHKIGNSILNTVCPIDGSNCIVTSSEGTVTRIHVD